METIPSTLQGSRCLNVGESSPQATSKLNDGGRGISLLPLFLSYPVSTHKKAGKLRLLKLSNEEITTLCSFSKRSCPFKYQSWKLSIYPFIIFTKDLCQFRAAKLCEISVIRTGNNVHPVFSFLLWISLSVGKFRTVCQFLAADVSELYTDTYAQMMEKIHRFTIIDMILPVLV